MKLAYKILKKGGVWYILQILHEQPNTEMKTVNLFKQIREEGGYYNMYLRTKDFMHESKLIEFYLDGSQNKMVCLTPFGKKMAKELVKLNKIVDDFLKPKKEGKKNG